MGTIILIIAFVIEAAFATYCIITKSNQSKVRSYIRIGAFAAFVIFTLVSVIEWSFRWYFLAALLLVWAALGAWTLIRKKEEKKSYKTLPLVFNAITMLVIVVIALTPALIFPQYKLPKTTGKYRVATVKYTYTDQSRTETFANTGAHRQVNVQFWYPQHAQGTHPLVVFSPGTASVKTSNTSTFMELASNGYVVCSIDHPYHVLFTIGADGHPVIIDQAYMQEYRDSNSGKFDGATQFKVEQKWMKLRTVDMNFVLDTIIERAAVAGSDEVYRLIDTTKIGLIGHSLGGAASAQVGRDRHDIGAVINLDGDLLGEALDYVDGKYVVNHDIYPVPILSIYTDDMLRLFAAVTDTDFVIPWRLITATAPAAYEVDFAGTNHFSVTDLPLFSPFLVSLIGNSVQHVGGAAADKVYVIEKMNDIVLQFFNVYLKGEGSFTSAGTY